MKTLSDIKDEVAREHGYDDWRSKIYENGDTMMEMLWEKVCKRYAGDWISVKDRLPEPNVRVLVCLTYGGGRKEITFSHWNPRVKCFDHFLENIITHWAPEPPTP